MVITFSLLNIGAVCARDDELVIKRIAVCCKTLYVGTTTSFPDNITVLVVRMNKHIIEVNMNAIW